MSNTLYPDSSITYYIKAGARYNHNGAVPAATNEPFWYIEVINHLAEVYQYGPDITGPGDHIVLDPSWPAAAGLTKEGTPGLNGDEISYLYISDTSITPGTYTVSVDDGHGFPVPKPRTYTFLAANDADITGVALTAGGTGEAASNGVAFTSQNVYLDTNTGGSGTFEVTASDLFPTGVLPQTASGLTIEAVAGGRGFRVTGTPVGLTNQEFSITVQYTEGAGHGGLSVTPVSDTFTLRVANYLVLPPAGSVGSPYSHDLDVAGLDTLDTPAFSVESGALPTGLTINGNTGVISGTPSAAGVFTPTIKVIGVDGVFLTKQFSISISTGTPITITVNPATISTNQSKVVTFKATTSTFVPVSWAQTSGPAVSGLPATSESGEYIQVTTPASNGTCVLTASCVGMAAAATCTITVNTFALPTVSISPSTTQTIDNAVNPSQAYSASVTGGALVPASGYWILGTGQGTLDSGGGTQQTIEGNAATIYRLPNPITTAGTNTLTFRPFADASLSAQVNVNFASAATSITNITPASPINETASTPITPVDFLAVGALVSGNMTWTLSGSNWVTGDNITWTHAPSGLSWVATNGAPAGSKATLSGTTTGTGGSFTFDVTVSQAGNGSFTKSYSLVISGGSVVISTIVPSSANISNVSAGTVTAVVSGTGFSTLTSPIVWLVNSNSQAETVCSTTYIGDTTLNIDIPITLAVATYYVRIKATGGIVVDNTSVTFLVYSSNTPYINSVSPQEVTAGSGSFVLAVNGGNFSANGKIWFNDVEQVTNITTSELGVNAANCTISAAAILTPQNSVPIVFKNSDGAASVPWTQFNILPTGLVISNSSLANATIGAAYSDQLTAAGGTAPYTFSVEAGYALPNGISMNSAGTFSGTVAANASTQTVLFKVTDAALVTATKSLTITVIGGSLTITSTSPLASARLNQAYSTTLTTSGGTPPFTWSMAGALPDGITFSAGVISGTPTNNAQVGQTFNISVTVTDSGGPAQTASKSFTLTLNSALSSPTISTISPMSGTIIGGTPVTITGTNFQNGLTVKFGSNYATSVAVTGGTSITCVTPSQAGIGAVTVTVTNPDTGVATYNSYTYITAVVPTLISIDKPDGPFAGGRTIILTGTDFTGTTSVKINNVACTSLVVDSDNQITCVTPAYGSTPTSKVDVNVSITNSAGTYTAVNAYTYRPAPTITAVTPSQGPTSGGITIYISGTNFFQKNGVKPVCIIGGVVIDQANITLVE